MADAVAELGPSDQAAPQRVLEAGYADPPVLRYGSRLRLGMVVPSVNSNAESHIGAMLPDDVTLHTTRLKMEEKDANAMLGFVDRIEEAASLLQDAGCQHILVNCTAVTTADPTTSGRALPSASARPPACPRPPRATASSPRYARCAPATS